MSERRFDPTLGEWVTFATHRQDRTFLPPAEFCPLCPTKPGSEFPTEIPRADFDIAVFDNRFPSLQPDPPAPDVASTDLYPVEPARGRCEVVVYSADHSTTLAAAGYPTVRLLVDVWADRTAVLGGEGHGYVMPFENKGEVIGVTLHHPHGQIYAYTDVPPRPLRELRAAADHRRRTGRCVECDVAAAETDGGDRVVAADGDWVAYVPFWARFPYEVRLAPRSHRTSLPTLGRAERDGLAATLTAVLRGYDALFGFSLPYVLAVHQRPAAAPPALAGWMGDWDEISHLHLEIDPPHRTETKLKYLAGSELMGGAFMTDAAPEDTAARLRAAVQAAR